MAGEAGLDRAVRWVHISELEDPTPWLSGGELLLTTGLQLGDDAQQRAYVARLADHGLSGLGFGAGLSYEHVPDALREAAAEHDVPAVRGPVRAAVHRDHRAGVLAARQRAVRRAAARAVGARAAGADRAVRARAGGRRERPGDDDRRPALIFDARGELLARRAGRVGSAATISALGAELRERTRAGGRRGYVPSADGFPSGALALPVARGAGRPAAATARCPEAWLIAAKDAGPLTELDRLTLHQAVTIVALELLRRRVVDDTERRLAGDVLTALVAGDLRGRRAGAAAGAVRAARPRRRAGAGAAARARAPPPRSRSPAACARRPAAGSSPPRAASCARCCRRPTTTSCSRWPRACTRASSARPASRSRPARAGRSRRAICGAASTRRAARSRRGRSPSTATATRARRSPRTATSAPSSCCSHSRTTTRCGCSATRSWRRSRIPRAPTAAS